MSGATSWSFASHAGVDPADIGGSFLLTSDEHQAQALAGTVAEAALRFHKVTAERAWTRHEEEDHLALRRRIRARAGIGFSSPKGPDHDRITGLVERAAARWNEKAEREFVSLRGTPAQEQELVDKLGVALQRLQRRAEAGAI